MAQSLPAIDRCLRNLSSEAWNDPVRNEVGAVSDPRFTRLAQAADLNYRIDLFGTVSDSHDPHECESLVELDLARRPVQDIKQPVAASRPRPVATSLPLSAYEFLKGDMAAPWPPRRRRPRTSPSARRAVVEASVFMVWFALRHRTGRTYRKERHGQPAEPLAGT
jgi:hypothetical protein